MSLQYQYDYVVKDRERKTMYSITIIKMYNETSRKTSQSWTQHLGLKMALRPVFQRSRSDLGLKLNVSISKLKVSFTSLPLRKAKFVVQVMTLQDTICMP
jgi:hypothetical protein